MSIYKPSKATIKPWPVPVKEPGKYLPTIINTFFILALGVLLLALIAIDYQANKQIEDKIIHLQSNIQALQIENEALWINLHRLQNQVDALPTKTSVQGVASWLTYQLEDSCAALEWPHGTRLMVSTDSASIICTVRDSGPYVPGRIVDLNRAQFEQLANPNRGLVQVTINQL